MDQEEFDREILRDEKGERHGPEVREAARQRLIERHNAARAAQHDAK